MKLNRQLTSNLISDSNESTHNDAKDETVVSDDGDRFHDETDLESEENLPIGTDFEDRFVRGN